MELRERVGGPVRCPYCHDDVEPTTARVCAACAAPHHRACWLVLGACSACAVGTARRSDPRTAPAPVLTDPVQRRAATRAALERARDAARQSALGWVEAAAIAALVAAAWPVAFVARDSLYDGPGVLGTGLVLLALLSVPSVMFAALAFGQAIARFSAAREAARRLRLFDDVDAAEAALRETGSKGDSANDEQP